MIDRKEVEALRALLAKADAKDVWMLATSNSWRRVLTIFGYPVITPCVDRDGHPNMDGIENLELAVAAVNALPELLRVYAAWLDAPEEEMYDGGGGYLMADLVVPEVMARLDGQRVRLLPAGPDGGAE